jgi:hypothetical protein
MADFTIPITVPDQNVDELLEVLKIEYGMFVDATPAEVRDRLSLEVIELLKKRVIRHRKDVAEANLTYDTTPPDIVGN